MPQEADNYPGYCDCQTFNLPYQRDCCDQREVDSNEQAVHRIPAATYVIGHLHTGTPLLKQNLPILAGYVGGVFSLHDYPTAFIIK